MLGRICAWPLAELCCKPHDFTLREEIERRAIGGWNKLTARAAIQSPLRPGPAVEEVEQAKPPFFAVV
jgi:hypothetical protein